MTIRQAESLKSRLFPQEPGIQVSLERVLIEVADRQVGVLIHDDPVFVDLLDLVEVDDVRTVDAHEIIGQPLFYLLHREEGDDGFRLTLDPNFQILAHALDITDIGDADFHDAVVGFEEENIVVRGKRNI